MRDYEEWHEAYDDPNSSLSWRLRVVSELVAAAIDRHSEHSRQMRVLSACSGDGRDLLDVLARRSDTDRVSATLVELHPAIAERARRRAVTIGANIEVRTADAGLTDSYIGAVPADLVLMVGIFGNVDAADLARTIAALPQFCSPGATVIWSRGIAAGGNNDGIRAQFAEEGFVESDYRVFDVDQGGPAVGMATYTGPPVSLVPGTTLFRFYR